MRANEYTLDLGNTLDEWSTSVLRGVRKITRLRFPIKQGTRPLKRSKTGLEVEMFVLDRNGIPTDASELLRRAKQAKIPVVKEANSCVIEVLCLPHQRHRSTTKWMAQNLLQLNELAQSMDLILYPYGTYPGTHEPVARHTPRYNAIREVLGPEEFQNFLRPCGFHQHYTLPRGMFDHTRKWPKYNVQSKLNRTVLDSHNLLAAMDPALTVLCQSSPYINGAYVGKDARALLYRGDAHYKFSQSAYRRHPNLASLPPYYHTLYDLERDLAKRFDLWKDLSRGKLPKRLLHRHKALSYHWGPIKVNPKGTLEYRGPDMTLFSHILAVSAIIKFALRQVQQELMIVVPADIEIEDAFKIEGNILYIVPYNTLQELSRAAAYEGLANKRLRIYTRRLYQFARSQITKYDPSYAGLLRPVRTMLDNRVTISDEMRIWARHNGGAQKLTDEQAAKMALHFSERFWNDLKRTMPLLDAAGSIE